MNSNYLCLRSNMEEKLRIAYNIYSNKNIVSDALCPNCGHSKGYSRWMCNDCYDDMLNVLGVHTMSIIVKAIYDHNCNTFEKVKRHIMLNKLDSK